MSKIVSIGTAVPAYCHQQLEILQFMQNVYCLNEADRRKLRFLYHHCGIRQRYSVVPDYSRSIHEWEFYAPTENLEPFPSLEQRMTLFNRQAPLLSADAIRNCLNGVSPMHEITHLITVSCTGLSAPGLDLQLLELLQLSKSLVRTSVNFMGCYAAIHALKIADAFCNSDKRAKVLIVCTELCTLHFQRDATLDSMASALLFGDGAAAVLVMANNAEAPGLQLQNFYSEIIPKGKGDMAWELSSTGFLMTLSSYVPDLIEEDFAAIVDRSLEGSRLSVADISGWCIHPGGKRILEAIQKSIGITADQLAPSYNVLQHYGNMSSATILFVLKELLHQGGPRRNVFGAAFGPGLTVETFTATTA